MGTILAIISTHAPAGGATRVLFALYAFNYNFYSRPCGRGDVGAPLEYASSVAISTHAPAGGATHSAAPSIFAPQYFYSRPCGRGDHFRLQLCDPCGLFLLTPLREGRR